MTTDTQDDRQNREIAPALPDPNASGWHRGSVWQMDAASSGAYGDDAVGMAYEARYWKANGDGTFAVVDMAYVVETCQTTNLPEVRDSHTIEGQYSYTVCADLEDPGGTEQWAEIDYDDQVDVLYHDDLSDAERIARDKALSDERYALEWDGQPFHRS